MTSRGAEVEGVHSDDSGTPSPRADRATGVVFDIAQSLTFLGIADEAGFLTSNHFLANLILAAEKGRDPISMQRMRTLVLSRALVHGGIDVLVPDHVRDSVLRSRLLKEGVDIQCDHPISEEHLNGIESIYVKLYNLARQIEEYPGYTGLYTLTHSGIVTAGATSRRLESLIDDYNFYARAFADRLGWVTDLAGDLFHAFMTAQRTAGDVYEQLFHVADTVEALSPADREGEEPALLTPREFSANFLIREMNAFPRQGAELDHDRGNEVMRGPFTLGGAKRSFDLMAADELLGFSDYALEGLSAGFTGSRLYQQVFGFWQAWLQFRQLIHVSSVRNSAICFDGTTSECDTGKRDDLTQLYRVYIADVNRIPRVDTFDDFLRLYHHPAVCRFREQLDIWQQAVRNGESAIVARMRHDFKLAIRDLRRACNLNRVGGMLTVVALPVALGGLLSGLPLDFAFTAVGPAIALKGAQLERRAQWARFGSL